MHRAQEETLSSWRRQLIVTYVIVVLYTGVWRMFLTIYLWQPGFFFETVAPLMIVSNTTLLAISTLTSEVSLF